MQQMWRGASLLFPAGSLCRSLWRRCWTCVPPPPRGSTSSHTQTSPPSIQTFHCLLCRSGKLACLTSSLYVLALQWWTPAWWFLRRHPQYPVQGVCTETTSCSRNELTGLYYGAGDLTYSTSPPNLLDKSMWRSFALEYKSVISGSRMIKFKV